MKTYVIILLLMTTVMLVADAKKRSSILDRMSNTLTEFIQRTLPDAANANADAESSSCSPMTLDYVDSFYRQVYSSNSSHFKLDENELESLIRFHVKRIVRDDNIKRQREKYKCNRNKVYIIYKILLEIKFF